MNLRCDPSRPRLAPSLPSNPPGVSLCGSTVLAVPQSFSFNTREQPSTIQVSSVRLPAVCALALITEHC